MRDFLEEEEYYYNLSPQERAAYNEQVIKDWNLDEEEAEFQRHFDEYFSFEDMKKLHKMKSDDDAKKPVSLRLGVSDLARLKAAAKEQGLQYQSLIGSILHRYVSGTLVDVSEVRKAFSIQSPS